MLENIDQMRIRHKNEIAKLQKTCKHIKHHRSRFMWAIGHFGGDVEICDWCGKILEHYNEMTPFDKPYPKLSQAIIKKALKKAGQHG